MVNNMLQPVTLPAWLFAPEPSGEPAQTKAAAANVDEIDPPTPPTTTVPSVPDETSPDVNEHWWWEITEADRQYLLSPHPPLPVPCPMCGYRGRHRRFCTGTDETIMAFGKHQGELVSDVPADYLRWLTRNTSYLQTDLREAIGRRLGR